MKCLDQQGLKYLWNLIKANFATRNEVTNHTGNTANPHNVTKAQIGLGEFDYEEGTCTPKFWSSSDVEQTFGSVRGYYKRIGNLCYIYIYAYVNPGASDVSVKYIDHLPFAPNYIIHGVGRPISEKETVFANGVGCYINVPANHGEIELSQVATKALLVEGIYSI